MERLNNLLVNELHTYKHKLLQLSYMIIFLSIEDDNGFRFVLHQCQCTAAKNSLKGSLMGIDLKPIVYQSDTLHHNHFIAFTFFSHPIPNLFFVLGRR